MSKSVRLSIIMPVYNVEKYVAAAIKSVIAQTFTDWELIIVNDGTKDNSMSICEEFASNDERITIYSKQNGGLSSARNYGIDRAKGEFITFIDSDDELLDKNTYQLAIKALDDYPDVSFVQFKTYKITSEGKMYIDFYSGKEELLLTQKKQYFESVETICDYLNKKRILSSGCCDKVFRCEIFSGLRFKEGIVFEDTTLSYQLFNKANSILLIPEGAYGYYTRANSITSQIRSLRAYRDQLNSQFGMLCGLIENGGDIYDIKKVANALRKFIIGIYVRHGLGSNLSAELKRLNHLCTMANIPQYNHLIIKVSAVAHRLGRMLKFLR